jgi:hypothetical protein
MTLACAKVFTGILINSENMTYTYPKNKVENFLALLNSALALYDKALAVPYKLLHRLEGKLTAMHLAVPPIMLWAKDISVIRTRGKPTGKIQLAEQEVTRLLEIPGVIAKHNGAPIRPLRAEIFAHIDAGGLGLGARVMSPRGDALTGPVEIATSLMEEEMGESSTLRELLALRMLLQQRGEEYQGRVLRVYFDSANAVRNIVNGGTTKNGRQHLLCKEIHGICEEQLITLQPDWVPRSCNERADVLSKIFDRGVLSAAARDLIQARFGQAHIITPVFTNVTRGILAGARNHDRLVVVAPKWRTQAWWPTLTRLGEKAGNEPLKLGAYADVFLPRTTHSPPEGWRFIAVLVLARDVQEALGKQ